MTCGTLAGLGAGRYAWPMRIMAFILLLAALPAAAKDVYRWVDPDGQPHYSDQWQPGAEKVRISESAVFSTPKPAVKTQEGGGKPPAQPAASAAPYTALEIASPAQEEVLWNIEGQLRVSIRVSPGLQPGHSLRLYLDGEAQDLAAGSTQTQLSGVYRGAHTLKAAVVDEAGKVLIDSKATTFMVRQTSLANPTRPVIRP